MSIDLTVVVLNQPYGNPGSLGEPLGIFSGAAAVSGDATGGFTRVTFVPQNPTTTPTLDDHRRQYVWFLDGMTVHDGATTPGNVGFEVFTHWARANFALAVPAVYNVNFATPNSVAAQFFPRDMLHSEVISRLPIFWDTQELAATNNQIVRITLANNVNNNEAEFSCYGRYYDRQILGNRGFGRLVAPPAISQFEGR